MWRIVNTANHVLNETSFWTFKGKNYNMANSGIVNRIFGIFPFLEILVRHIYWKTFIFTLLQLKKNKSPNRLIEPIEKVYLEWIFEQWTKWGIKPGDILILNSSYFKLGIYHLEPEEIIDRIIKFLGPDGTLVMPAFAYFKNMPKGQDYLRKCLHSESFYYDASKNFITTGILPGTLLKYKGAVRSRFPINSLLAFGRYALEIFEKEWTESNPLPCGKGSAWEYLSKKNAKIVSLGTDLTHSLTMIHVAEDVNPNWPIHNWYRKRKYIINGVADNKELILQERDPKWGALYFAERKLCDDLICNGLMKSVIIDDVLTEMIESVALLDYLNSRNIDGYPYYCIPKKYKNR